MMMIMKIASLKNKNKSKPFSMCPAQCLAERRYCHHSPLPGEGRKCSNRPKGP